MPKHEYTAEFKEHAVKHAQAVGVEQMELSTLRSENAPLKMHLDTLQFGYSVFLHGDGLSLDTLCCWPATRAVLLTTPKLRHERAMAPLQTACSGAAPASTHRRSQA